MRRILYCPQHLVIGPYFGLDQGSRYKMCDCKKYRSMIRNLVSLSETSRWSDKDVLLSGIGVQRAYGQLSSAEGCNKCLAASTCGGMVEDNDD